MKKEQLTVAKVSDKIKKYQKTGLACATNFLDPAEVIDVQHLVSKIPHSFWGGYKNAERKILVFGIDELDARKQFYEEFLEVIFIEANSGKELSHRNILGSLLGLGISREVVGDIILEENRANIIVSKEISKYILQNLEKIGSEKVNVCKCSFENIIKKEDNYKEIKTTVASLRLDAMVSASIGVSREISSKLIEGEKVKLNYRITENTSKQVKVGDKISIRGYGRIELLEILGETRKDRIRVLLKKSCN